MESDKGAGKFVTGQHCMMKLLIADRVFTFEIHQWLYKI
jgi:hypothetical protein